MEHPGHVQLSYWSFFRRGCAARNPVTNIAAMPGVSDIPDWCFNEAGMSFDYQPPGLVQSAVQSGASAEGLGWVDLDLGSSPGWWTATVQGDSGGLRLGWVDLDLGCSTTLLGQ